jgi:hypothetical protein
MAKPDQTLDPTRFRIASFVMKIMAASEDFGGRYQYRFFFLPLAEASSPRNTILGHALGLICGYAAFAVTSGFGPTFAAHWEVHLPRVLAAALALLATGALMALFQVSHPPAGATTLSRLQFTYYDNPCLLGLAYGLVGRLPEAEAVFNRMGQSQSRCLGLRPGLPACRAGLLHPLQHPVQGRAHRQRTGLPLPCLRRGLPRARAQVNGPMPAPIRTQPNAARSFAPGCTNTTGIDPMLVSVCRHPSAEQDSRTTTC